MFQIILLSSVLVAIAFLAIGVGIIFFNRKFPETEIGHNKEMRKRGIECAKCSEWRNYRQAQKFKKLSLDLTKLELK